tara:strand:+ start:868 stop:1527 length:660 start_codon:yes stop_codon:yes gene_type:complete
MAVKDLILLPFSHLRARWGSGSSEIDDVRMDASTNSLQFIDYPHHGIHGGSAFHVGYSLVTANSDDDVTGIMLKTPDTAKWGHLTATFMCSDPAEAIINEAPTLADEGDGTDKLIFNRNRNSATTSVMQSLEDVPTVGSVTTINETEWTNVGVSGGTELEHVFSGGGTGAFTVGGPTRGAQEWMLKQNTIYVFYLQNTGANANAHSISLDWYEHTDKNS